MMSSSRREQEVRFFDLVTEAGAVGYFFSFFWGGVKQCTASGGYWVLIQVLYICTWVFAVLGCGVVLVNDIT